MLSSIFGILIFAALFVVCRISDDTKWLLILLLFCIMLSSWVTSALKHVIIIPVDNLSNPPYPLPQDTETGRSGLNTSRLPPTTLNTGV